MVLLLPNDYVNLIKHTPHQQAMRLPGAGLPDM
jgi:hypothetical protein